MRYPEVSVLISCFNASRWLREAIDSVLTQTFDDFELVLVDDGSTDGTRDIIEDYRVQDRRIVAISKKNTGLADSLNVGISRARGAWIARLDADDLCEPRRLGEQTRFMRRHPDMVLLGSGYTEIDEQGQAITTHLYPSGHAKLVRHLERSRRFFPHSSAFYRVDEVRHVGGYNSRYVRAQDSCLWMALALRGKIACLPEPLVRIRNHSGQISHANDGKRQFYDGIAAGICHFLRKARCEDPSVAADRDEWITFLNWVESQINGSDTLVKRRAWAEARDEYFATRNRLAGILRFSSSLLKSGHACALMWERVFGSSLPERLARKWMERPCAGS